MTDTVLFWLIVVPLIVLIWLIAGYLAYGFIYGVAI